MLARSMSMLKPGRSVLMDANGVVLAGNKTLEAARQAGVEQVIVVRTTGDELVAVMREDLDLTSPDARGDKARQMAYADNRVGQVSLRFSPRQVVEDIAAGIELGDFFTPMELAELGELANAVDDADLENMFAGMDEDTTPVSTGELLALVDITIGEPRHVVHRGEVYQLRANDGVTHTLVIADVIAHCSGRNGKRFLWAMHKGAFRRLKPDRYPGAGLEYVYQVARGAGLDPEVIIGDWPFDSVLPWSHILPAGGKLQDNMLRFAQSIRRRLDKLDTN